MKIRQIVVTATTVLALGATSALAAAPNATGSTSPTVGQADRADGKKADEKKPGEKKAGEKLGGKGDKPRAHQDKGGDKAGARPPRYQVKPGVTFNHPGQGGKAAFRIIDKIKETIAHVRKGGRIRIMSWNFTSSGIADRLIAAHRRGVSVQFIMARSLSNTPQFRRLTAALRKGNAGRPPALKSFTKTCSHSCRGGGGSMHSKFMVINQVGRSKQVVMEGSSNFTSTAATAQWNDWFTTVGNKTIYKKYMQEFNLAKKDRKSTLKDFRAGDISGWFSPRKNQGDVVLRMLNKVKCTGAQGTGTGRTKIRIASAVWQNDRGQAIGRRVAQLQRQGCDIRVVFTMMTQIIRNTMSNVPKRHLVYDYNGDGSFDRYLHMKAMSISGHYGKKRNAKVVFNGSANWSTLGVISDEQGLVIYRGKVERQYTNWITGLYNNAPLGYRPLPQSPPKKGFNPYAELELELQ